MLLRSCLGGQKVGIFKGPQTHNTQMLHSPSPSAGLVQKYICIVHVGHRQRSHRASQTPAPPHCPEFPGMCRGLAASCRGLSCQLAEASRLIPVKRCDHIGAPAPQGGSSPTSTTSRCSSLTWSGCTRSPPRVGRVRCLDMISVARNTVSVFQCVLNFVFRCVLIVF